MLNKILSIIDKFSLASGQPCSPSLDIEEAFDQLILISDQLILEYVELKLVSSNKDNEYEQLELAVQKGEGDIRVHIRLEQQMKLYSDSIQTKLDDTEKMQEETTIQNSKIMKDKVAENLKLKEQVKKLQEELNKLDSLAKQNDQQHENAHRTQDFISQLKEQQKKFTNEYDTGAGRSQPKMHIVNSSHSSSMQVTQIKSYRDNGRSQVDVAEKNKSDSSRLVDLSRTSRQVASVATNKNISMRNIRDLRVSQHNSQESQVNNSKNNSQHSSNSMMKIYNTLKVLPRKDSAQSRAKNHYQLATYLDSKR